MLVTNKEFLKEIQKKKVYVAFDISGSVPDNIREQFVETMMQLCSNCKIKSKPIMLTFDTQVKQIDYHYVGRIEQNGLGGTDLERLYAFISVQHEQPDVLLIISDGVCVWPKTNMLPDVDQYMVVLGTKEQSYHPSYVTVVEEIEI